MKTKSLFLLLLLSVFISCKKDEPGSEILKGKLKLNVGLFISVNDIENNLKSTKGIENFLVTIFNAQGNEVMVFQEAGDMPEEIELDPGQYFVTAHSNNDLPAAFSNPFYYGETELFSIVPGGQETISLNCELANSMVTIIYSDQVKANYSDYQTTVSTNAGSLLFSKNEVRPGYFRPLPISIKVDLTWQKGDGTVQTKTLTGLIPDPQPRRNYEIHIDASSASGSAFINISLDSLPTVEIVDVNEIIYGSGELLITEIMADPATIDDIAGEWFEIYNTTDQPIDLFHVVIRKNTTERHVINSNLIIPANCYVVLAKSANAVSEPDYIYSSISLNNSGAELSLYHYGTDGTDGSLIFSVNYAAAEFPEARGASICLSPELLNYSAAVSGSSWCVSRSIFSTGDLGTPGSSNDSCD